MRPKRPTRISMAEVRERKPLIPKKTLFKVLQRRTLKKVTPPDIPKAKRRSPQDEDQREQRKETMKTRAKREKKTTQNFFSIPTTSDLLHPESIHRKHDNLPRTLFLHYIKT
jgi:hypothetical protein